MVHSGISTDPLDYSAVDPAWQGTSKVRYTCTSCEWLGLWYVY